MPPPGSHPTEREAGAMVGFDASNYFFPEATRDRVHELKATAEAVKDEPARFIWMDPPRRIDLHEVPDATPDRSEFGRSIRRPTARGSGCGTGRSFPPTPPRSFLEPGRSRCRTLRTARRCRS